MEMRILYSTIDSIENAQMLAHTVLTKNIAACVNIIPNGISMYLEDNSIKQTQEVYIIFKTNAHNITALKQTIANQHPYEIPCLIEITPHSTNHEFIRWLENYLRK